MTAVEFCGVTHLLGDRRSIIPILGRTVHEHVPSIHTNIVHPSETAELLQSQNSHHIRAHSARDRRAPNTDM